MKDDKAVTHIIKNSTPIPEGHGRLCDADRVIDKPKSMERLYINDELRTSILEDIIRKL